MELDIFQYYNLFPADVKRPAQLLLCFMSHFSFPLHLHAVRKILKPLLCDELAPALLQNLILGGYLARTETNVGPFFSLTAKTYSFLDILNETNNYRTTKVQTRELLTYYLKGCISAHMLLRFGSSIFVKTWFELSEEKREQMITHEVNQDILNSILKARNDFTINVIPRNLVSMDSVAQEMINTLKIGYVPFTKEHNRLISADYTLQLGLAYDDSMMQVQRLSASLNASNFRDITASSDAQRFDKLEIELADARETANRLKPAIDVFTYSNMCKTLSPAILECNGIFILSLPKDGIIFGILNNAEHSLSQDVWLRRIDYCVSLADKLNRACLIQIYTRSSDKEVAEKALNSASKRMNTHMIMPNATWIYNIFRNVASRSTTWAALK